MRIKLQTLTLVCRQKQEVIEFSPQVSFFHGKMSAGKSTIARLIDYCLGAKDIERTTAIKQELVSVELSAQIEAFAVRFERTAQPVGTIQVSWRESGGDEFSVLAPLVELPNSQPLVGNDVFTFSDLMFFFFGMTPLKVRKSALDEDSPMVRLSFRDIRERVARRRKRLPTDTTPASVGFNPTPARTGIVYVRPRIRGFSPIGLRPRD